MTTPYTRTAIFTLGLLLAACASQPPETVQEAPGDTVTAPKSRYAVEHDFAPLRPISPEEVVDAMPKPDPILAVGNMSPYVIGGVTYEVLKDHRNYSERGIASWYGAKFHGRATSSMELYDMCSFTAAHKTLPLPSYARVTNLDNGRSVVVRVNDRGPFHEGRVVDLSYVAALKLGVYETGTARVEVEAIGPQDHVVLPPAPVRADGRVYLQLGAFGERANAESLRNQLLRVGERAEIRQSTEQGRHIYRVRLGPLANPERAEETKARLRLAGFVATPIVIAD